MASIGRVPMLTHCEELIQAKAVQVWLHDPAPSRAVERRGRRARERLINANLRLVVYWAKRYQGRGLDLPELVQEGNLGLIRAAEKFDHEKGYRFSTYASWWVRQAITRAICDKSRSVRVPQTAHQIVNKARRTAAELFAAHGTEPSLEVVAALMGMEAGKLREYSEMVGRASGVLSLDAPCTQHSSGSAVSFAELVSAPEVDWAEEMDRGLAVKAMKAAIEELPEEQQTVFGRVLAGVGRNELGVSRMDYRGCMEALREKLHVQRAKRCTRLRSKVLALVPPAGELAVALKGLDLLAA